VLTLDSGAAINIEPASGSAILLDGTISIDAGVVTGATSITSTAFVGNLTGNASGTAATVTGAAQSNITSLGTLTALTVDDVAIDGKVITMTGSTSDTAVFTVGTNGTLSIVTTDDNAAAANIQITADGTVDIDSAGVLTLDSGAAINIEPASGSAILLDGTISIDAGVVTGATSITSTVFVGNVTGNVTGNTSGSSGSCTGNAATATALASAVNIGGTSFDGTSSIVPGTITVADTTDTSSFVALFESATGNLAPKTDAGITYNAGTGTLTATAFAGPLTGNVTGNASGTALTVTQAAQTAITSLGTLTALTVDDVAIDGKVITMTGSTDDTAVFTVGTNGTLSIVTTDNAAAAANIEITADGTVDINSAGVLTLDSGAAINIEPASGSAILLDGTISIDAGVVTGATSITSTAFVGNVTGNVSGTAATVTGGTQASITTVANVVEVGTLDAGSITSGFGNIDNGGSSIACGSLDVSDGNITNVGDIDCDSISVADAANGLNIDVSGANNGTAKITLKDNVATALDVTEASNSYMKFTTTDNASRIVTNVGVVGNTTALTSQSGSVVINAALGNYFTVATSGNITGLDIQNAVVGQKILIRFAWGGDHSLAFTDTVIWPGGTVPGTTASGVDMIGFLCTTASSAFDGFIVGEDIKSS